MKLKTFTAFALALTAGSAAACGPYWFAPTDMVLYKMGDAPFNTSNPALQREQAGLEAWRQLTGSGISTDDIAQVMRYSVRQIEDPNRNSRNPFERWLEQHPRASQYLSLAKRCEQTREKMCDPWYYPDSEEWWEESSIEQIESEARSHSPAEMQGRYVLLAIRAMMSRHRYEDCVHYWDSVQSEVTCRAVRDLIEPNLVGCRFHMGDSVAALNDFIRLGDVESTEYCARKMGIDLLDCAGANPELYIFQVILDSYLQELDCVLNECEQYYDYYDEEYKQKILSRCRHRRDQCLKVLREHRPRNAAMWLYAAAAMSDALGEGTQALNLCNRALKAAGHWALDERTRVLRFHIQARYMPLGKRYDAMLRQGTRLLAALTARDLNQFTSQLCYDYSWDGYQTNKNDVFWDYHKVANYYWKDMLLRIVCGEAVPRLVKAGKTTQALLLSNMAENYLMHLTHADSLMQRYDNSTFMLADSLTARQVQQYRDVVAHPRGDFERWLVRWGYNDADYWNELLGTLCLRDMNYSRAINYLSKVSHRYQRSMNIWPYMKQDPKRYQRVEVVTAIDYKLRYARHMLVAQQTLSRSRDPNARAQAMLQLAVGLENAIGEWDEDGIWLGSDCWPLLQYKASSYYYSSGQAYEKQAKAQLAMAERWYKEAFSTFTDHELAAKWMVECCLSRTAIERYPHTATARHLLTQCDNLRLYYSSAK